MINFFQVFDGRRGAMCTLSRLIDFENVSIEFFLTGPVLSQYDHACVKLQNKTEKLQFLINIAFMSIFSYPTGNRTNLAVKN